MSAVENRVVEWKHTPPEGEVSNNQLIIGLPAQVGHFHDQKVRKAKHRMLLTAKDLQHLSLMCAKRFDQVRKAEHGYRACFGLDRVSQLDKLELAVFEIGSGEELDDSPWWLRSENGFTICDDSPELVAKNGAELEGEDDRLETILLECAENVFSMKCQDNSDHSDFQDCLGRSINCDLGTDTEEIYEDTLMCEEAPNSISMEPVEENTGRFRLLDENETLEFSDTGKAFPHIDVVSETSDSEVTFDSKCVERASFAMKTRFDKKSDTDTGNSGYQDTADKAGSEHANDTLASTAIASGERLDRIVEKHRYRNGDSRELMVLSLVDMHCHDGMFAGMLSGRARQVELFMSKIRRNSLIIFDWDDTILPTAWLRGNGALDGSPFEICGLDAMDHMTVRAKNWMRYYCTLVRVTLQMASALGRVVIVSNSCENWMQRTAELFMSDAAPELKLCEIVSARSEYSKDCDEPQQWKLNCFGDIVRRWADLVRTDAVCNVDVECSADGCEESRNGFGEGAAVSGGLRLFGGTTAYEQVFWRAVPTASSAIDTAFSSLYRSTSRDGGRRYMRTANTVEACGGDIDDYLERVANNDGIDDSADDEHDTEDTEVPIATTALSGKAHTLLTKRSTKRSRYRVVDHSRDNGVVVQLVDAECQHAPRVDQLSSRVSTSSGGSLVSTDCEEPVVNLSSADPAKQLLAGSSDFLKQLKSNFYPEEVYKSSWEAAEVNDPHVPPKDTLLFDLSSPEFTPYLDHHATATDFSKPHEDPHSDHLDNDSTGCSNLSATIAHHYAADHEDSSPTAFVSPRGDDCLQVLSVGDSVHERNACLATSTSLGVRVKSVKLQLRPDISTLVEQHLMLQQLMFEIMGTVDVPIVDLMIRRRKSVPVFG